MSRPLFIARTHCSCIDCGKTYTVATLSKYDGERCGRCYGKFLEEIAETVKSLENDDVDVWKECEEMTGVVEKKREMEEYKEYKEMKEGKRSDSNVYEVEKILDARIIRSKFDTHVEYLIKWVGYTESTWEDEKNCTDCREKIDEFENEDVYHRW